MNRNKTGTWQIGLLTGGWIFSVAIAAFLFVAVATHVRGDEPARDAKANDTSAKDSPAKDSDSKESDAKDSDSKDAAADDDPLVKELRATKDKLDDAMPAMSAIADPEFRTSDGAKIRPLLKKSAELLLKLAAKEKDDSERAGLERDRCQYLGMLATLGDDDARASLEELAGGLGSQTIMAKSALALSKWWQASKDAAAQEKILTDYTTVAKANTTNDNVVLTLAIMATIGSASDDNSIKAAEVLRKVMTTDRAKKLASQIDPNGALRELVGKPLVASGRTTLGKTFSTADWKGKVVMLDFWATWCGPCNEEIPRMKEIYKTYHSKGLEMIGVDCDSDDDTVISFTKDKQMPWPQLRETSQGGSEQWHPLAVQWGVMGIPTMFLIDKKGVLRYIDAREDTNSKIEALLSQ